MVPKIFYFIALACAIYLGYKLLDYLFTPEKKEKKNKNYKLPKPKDEDVLE